jgi:hypothetical protein
MGYGPAYWLARSLGISDLAFSPTSFHYDLVADAQKLLSQNGPDGGPLLPGPQLLPSIIASFAQLEEFQTRLKGDNFFRRSFELLQRAATDSWVDGKNCFDAREFMRVWRAWRDSVIIRG